MTEKQISCRNLKLQFGKGASAVLQDVDLAIPANSIVMLYGATGKGKTSLFNVLTGLNLSGFRQGKVYWGDHQIRSTRQANRLRPDYISLIYSHFYFLQSLSIQENIFLPAVFAGKSKKEMYRRLELLGEIFDFDDQVASELNLYRKILYRPDNRSIRKKTGSIRQNKISNLSNGQREIVNIARAFILDTPFVFADELLRSYSEAETEAVWKRLLDPRLGIRRNKSLFMITRKDYFRKDPNVDLIYEISGQSVQVGSA